MMNNIVVIFGTFNPLTMAHIQIGLLAKEKVKADKVIYVVAKDSFLNDWKKMDSNSVMASPIRFELMRQALSPYDFTVSDIEITNQSDGKTYNSINLLKSYYPDSNFYIVMGTDKVGELHSWYQGEQLISENKFLIIDRDDTTLADVISQSPLAGKYSDNFISIANQKFSSLSSTKIREAYLSNELEKYRSDLPENIYEYLMKHKNIFKKGNHNMTNLHSFVKVATASFTLRLGDVDYNKQQVIKLVQQAAANNAELIVFPELTLTGYSCGDMFLRSELTEKAKDVLVEIAESLTEIEGDVDPLVVCGLPYRHNDKLYNCAAYLHNGEILALSAKTYLPNYNEFYEKRWFASALENKDNYTVINGKQIPFTTNVIIDTASKMKVGCEICEDLWVNQPVSISHCKAHANIIVNLSASNELVTKHQYRTDLVRMISASNNCAYLYVSSGHGESTTDVVYSSAHLISQSGTVLVDDKQSFKQDSKISYALIDLERIENDRIRLNSCQQDSQNPYLHISITTNRKPLTLLPEYVNPYPFIPADKAKRSQRCKEILQIQATGLATRLQKINCKKTVIGISGGLDSTLALLVIKEAYDLLDYPYSDIIAITMPGFGTSKQTKSSADRLMKAIGVTALTIDITQACKVHMKDIGQKEDNYDVTFENIQARERTQILMDMANKVNGIVVGTGDLSELALGWCTYNGDHMSNYAVNVSVPKTLVKFIIETYSENCPPYLHDVLIDICNTVISPELIPTDENGNIAQSTEAVIGKYDLHDFFLYHYIRNGFSKEKILDLACIAFKPLNISKPQIEETLNTFIRRFKTNQFKRSCLPDGPKVGTVSLSPRGDWRMPSDYQG
ncbi:MAG: NAD(+) synthase [Erysipelotrichaceae bacterium]